MLVISDLWYSWIYSLFEGAFDNTRGTFQEFALSPAAYTAKVPSALLAAE